MCHDKKVLAKPIDVVSLGVIHLSNTNILAISTLITSVAAMAAVGIGIFQAHRMRQGWQAQNALEIARDLQSAEQREARGLIYSLKGNGVPFVEWSDEEKHLADKVFQQLNTAAYLQQRKLLPNDLLEENWGNVFRSAYRAASERVQERRDRGDRELWRPFEEFALALLKVADADPFYSSASSERHQNVVVQDD